MSLLNQLLKPQGSTDSEALRHLHMLAAGEHMAPVGTPAQTWLALVGVDIMQHCLTTVCNTAVYCFCACPDFDLFCA